MNTAYSEMLNTAEQAAIKQDKEIFKKIFPNCNNNPTTADWQGLNGNLPLKEIAADYPHIRHYFLSEHRFSGWEKFAVYMELLADGQSIITQFESAADAIVCGDVDRLQLLLKNNPALVTARSMRVHHAALLHYVGANGVEQYRQKTPANIIEAAWLVLQAGADINAVADMYSKDTTLGLTATSVHPYIAGVQNALVQFLLNNGAVMNALPGENIVTACLANGRGEAAEYLALCGAEINLEAAAGLGDIELVKTFFEENGNLKKDVSIRQMQHGFEWACQYNRPAVVSFLLQCDVDAYTQQQGLHWAAVCGHTEIIQLFVQSRAPLETRNKYGGTVLGAALWGAYNNSSGKDFKPAIKMLLDAGADIYADKGLEDYVNRLMKNEDL